MLIIISGSCLKIFQQPSVLEFLLLSGSGDGDLKAGISSERCCREGRGRGQRGEPEKGEEAELVTPGGTQGQSLSISGVGCRTCFWPQTSLLFV